MGVNVQFGSIIVYLSFKAIQIVVFFGRITKQDLLLPAFNFFLKASEEKWVAGSEW